MKSVDPKRAVTQITQRLSLRKPQAEALRRLDDIVDLIAPTKDTDVADARDAVRSVYGNVDDATFEDFERDFPSVCFALATGVGKTRLMGAFISYLYMIGKSRNFFVLAPNLTIYEKLLSDFQPTSPKYVFRGIEAFAHNPPLIVNAENYEEGRGVRGTDFFGREGAIINIFNISKINSEVRGGNAPRIKRLQEYIGDSYFAYLSELDDLVLLMDEAHRYRGSAGAKAIAELKPILGLEVTATPKTVGAKSQAFKNVVYSYDLPEAMEDGYVKEPAVGTRANFNPKSVDEATLERIKLEDGINYHEHVKVALETYARSHDVRVVRPFMLVVTQDTTHARDVRNFIESDQFFDGRYNGRVIEIHSKLTGEESDENAQRLLNIEKGGDTDIVIHVNKLKEGWDVSNLFTIVPLRASASDILTEQTLGRGLRLPYGKRTGVAVVDQLTVIAHDRFNDLIERAKEDNGVTRKLKTVTIGDGGDIPAAKPVVVVAPSMIEQMVLQAEAQARAAQATPVTGGDFTQPATTAANSGFAAPPAPPFRFSKPEEVNLAKTVLSVVMPEVAKQVSSIKDLQDPKVVQRIAETALAAQGSAEGQFQFLSVEQAVAVAEEVCKQLVERTIAIPTLTITPREQVAFGFSAFQLDLKTWNYQPLSRELLIQVLRTEKRDIISGEAEGEAPARLEDYLVARLMDYPEVDYDAHAAILYDLAGQVVGHFRTKYPDEEKLRAVIQGHARAMADAVFAQMKQNMWRGQTSYRVTVNSAFDQLRPQTFDGSNKGAMRDYRDPPEPLNQIRRFIFTGFDKGCYQLAKFDSDTERKMAVILERDPTVRLWMKPGPNQFKIYDTDGNSYQPDFVVETDTEKFIIETKSNKDMTDASVLRKAETAALWAFIATAAQTDSGSEKPWSYLLVPEDAVIVNATVTGLAASFTKAADTDLRGRYSHEQN